MPSLLHFGLGNFHRAHQAVYTQLANDKSDEPPWTIIGVSLRSAKIRDQLAPQNFDYSLVIKDRNGSETNTVTCLETCLVAGEQTPDIIAQIADPKMHLITLTVTEKAYCLDQNGALDLQNPAVQKDQSGHAETLYGLLAQGIAARPADAPLTVLSCDNLADNGGTLARAFARFAPHLADRIGTHLRFPSSMVDRITPATTQALSDAMAASGNLPCAPVETERFSEWVIEDNFAGEHPNWEAVGAKMVPDVAPYELRKLRLLNGAHSYLAYAGTMAGFEFVHQAIADPALRAGVLGVMTEAIDTLPEQTKTTAKDYANQLIERFENPHLHHKLRQIAMDGSQKLSPRLIGTWADRMASGLTSPAIEAAILAWVHFVQSETGHGRDLDDPQAAALAGSSPADALRIAGAPEPLISRLLA